MIILFSPTKQMDFDSELAESLNLSLKKIGIRKPCFSDEAELINQQLKQFSRKELEDLMKISQALSETVIRAIQSFGSSTNTVRPALTSYSGTSFKALDASSLSLDELSFADEHLRILSGMYGLLQPLDGIENYRLEMKTRLCVSEHENLNQFWKPRVTRRLALDPQLKDPQIPILNLASGEYMKIVDQKSLRNPLISIQFKDLIGGKLKTVGMYSKAARGLMLRKILEQRIEHPNELLAEETVGYQFDPALSKEYDWVFVREQRKEL